MELLSIFSAQYLDAALLVCLLSVGVLVALFFYLNRYTQRHYFAIWATAWLFYGLWLMLKLTMPTSSVGSIGSLCKLLCIETSAVFLLWGSFRFLRLETPQRLMALFLGFLYVWSFAAPMWFEDLLLIQEPCFLLMGTASVTAGMSFLWFREHRRYVGARLLSLGFLLWGSYLAMYPLVQADERGVGAAFFFSAIVQLFIAVSMIVLVLEEVRATNDAMTGKIESINAEREALQMKMRDSERQMRTLFADASLKVEMQRAYEELRSTHLAVLEQERLSVLGQIASGMAHDINNALTPLLGFSELLVNHQEDTPDRVKEGLKHIRQAGRRIEHIVGRVRQFYRERGDYDLFGNVSVNVIATEAVKAFRSSEHEHPKKNGAKHSIELKLADSLPDIQGNPEELKEALVQLLSNAEDAMPKGGKIEVRTCVAELAPDSSNDGTAPKIILEVRDEGIGMDETVRQRCIEPFFSTKQPRRSGLGLATAHGAMHRHHGALRITSELGRGTTVGLLFPIEEPSRPRHANLEFKPTTSPLRILCIDDEPLVRTLLQDMLQMQGHVAETADGGQEGITAFETSQTSGQPFAVVITDLGMPDVDGRQVVQAIKRISPHTPVALLTGWATLLDTNDPLLQQVEVLLKKPLSLEQLQAALVRLTESRPEPDRSCASPLAA